LKKHNRLFRELQKAYINEGAAKKPSAVEKPTFQEQEVKKETINSASLVKMIKDFKLENGLQH